MSDDHEKSKALTSRTFEKPVGHIVLTDVFVSGERISYRDLTKNGTYDFARRQWQIRIDSPLAKEIKERYG